MFTAVEIEWLKSFLETYILKGDYTHYVAYTIDNTSSSYNSEQYDFMVLISDEEITKNGLSYTTQGNFQLVKVDSSSASSNYTNARYVISEGTGTTVSVNEYNHVYSNCGDTDLIAYEVDQQKYFEEYYTMIENSFLSCLSLIAIVVLIRAFSSAFPNRVGD